MHENIFHYCQALKSHNPLVLNLTNSVSIQTVANVLLAAGASPVMSAAADDIADLIHLTQALYLNIGTPDAGFMSLAKFAQSKACAKQLPIVLDPVGAGASRYRSDCAQKLLEAGVTIIRGNSSEIMALAGSQSKPKGVDAASSSDVALEAAQTLAKTYNVLVVVSGAIDYVVSRSEYVKVDTGHALMTKVTGLGCALSALVAAFAAVQANAFEAALAAVAMFGTAGKQAAQLQSAPGGFYTSLLDHLYELNQDDLKMFCAIEKPRGLSDGASI